MTIRRLLLPAALAVFISFHAGGAFFAPAPAAAFSSFGTDENTDEGENLAAREFLKAHGGTLIVCLAVGMGALFVFFMGPADVLDAWKREGGKYGGRRFFGNEDSTPGFGSGGFGSSYKL